METKTLDIQKLLSDYVDDLNVAVESRQFPPFVQKWFAVPQCMLSFKHETQGIENAKTLWTHLLPIGVEGAPREVLQFPYKVEDGRVYAWRQLQGGAAPKPMYGLQETQFDDHTLISEISIKSVQDKPEVDEDPAAPTSRLGRIFGAFADAFNDFFQTGDTDIIEPWCSDDIVMKLDSTFWGMGVIGPHNRIAQTARFSLSGWETEGDRIKAQVDFTGWGSLCAGRRGTWRSPRTARSASCRSASRWTDAGGGDGACAPFRQPALGVPSRLRSRPRRTSAELLCFRVPWRDT